jgi:tol-pal system-associated acyl-CoA thioesterase
MSFEFPVRVYWEDTDAGGIVFYANYLKFFERARTEWLRHLGLEQHRLKQDTGGMFVVIDTQLKYHRPAQLDDLLQVSAVLQDKGRASSATPRRSHAGRNRGAASVDTGPTFARFHTNSPRSQAKKTTGTAQRTRTHAKGIPHSRERGPAEKTDKAR